MDHMVEESNFFPDQRIVCLLDVDCFYVQVAQKCQPELVGQPTVVCQYGNRDLILSASYEARAFGVKKVHRLSEARRLCPGLQVARVPQYEGIELANLEFHYEESAKIFEHVAQFCGEDAKIERASVDECYIDLSAVTYRIINSPGFQEILASDSLDGTVFGNAFLYPKDPLTKDMLAQFKQGQWSSEVNLHLLCGLFVGSQLCRSIETNVGYRCSCGVGINKMLAKLTCGENKPAAYTLLPINRIDAMLHSNEVANFRGLGGLFGQEIVSKLNVKYLGEVQCVPADQLKEQFPYCSEKIRELAFGFDNEPVQHRLQTRQISLSKENTRLDTQPLWDFVQRMTRVFVDKCLSDKVKNNRVGRKLQVSTMIEGRRTTRTFMLPGTYGHGQPVKFFLSVLQQYFENVYKSQDVNDWKPPVNHINLSVNTFEQPPDEHALISSYFQVRVEDLDVIPVRKPQPVYQIQRTAEESRARLERLYGKKKKSKNQPKQNDKHISYFFRPKPTELVQLDDEDSDVIVDELGETSKPGDESDGVCEVVEEKTRSMDGQPTKQVAENQKRPAKGVEARPMGRPKKTNPKPTRNDPRTKQLHVTGFFRPVDRSEIVIDDEDMAVDEADARQLVDAAEVFVDENDVRVANCQVRSLTSVSGNQKSSANSRNSPTPFKSPKPRKPLNPLNTSAAGRQSFRSSLKSLSICSESDVEIVLADDIEVARSDESLPSDFADSRPRIRFAHKSRPRLYGNASSSYERAPSSDDLMDLDENPGHENKGQKAYCTYVVAHRSPTNYVKYRAGLCSNHSTPPRPEPGLYDGEDTGCHADDEASPSSGFQNFNLNESDEQPRRVPLRDVTEDYAVVHASPPCSPIAGSPGASPLRAGQKRGACAALPPCLDQIPADVWADLTPAIRAEIAAHYARADARAAKPAQQPETKRARLRAPSPRTAGPPQYSLFSPIQRMYQSQLGPNPARPGPRFEPQGEGSSKSAD